MRKLPILTVLVAIVALIALSGCVQPIHTYALLTPLSVTLDEKDRVNGELAALQARVKALEAAKSAARAPL